MVFPVRNLRCGFSCLLFWIPGTKLPKNVFYRQEKALEALNEFLWMKVVSVVSSSVQQALFRGVVSALANWSSDQKRPYEF